MLAKLLVMTSFQKMHQLMGHNINKALRSFLCKLEIYPDSFFSMLQVPHLVRMILIFHSDAGTPTICSHF